MRSCPSCGGIIGRDCFNAVECAEITRRMDVAKCNCGCDQLLGELDYIRSVDMPHLESKIQDACEVINKLYDMIIDPTATQNGVSLSFAEEFIKENYTPKINPNPNLSDLPF